jgi:uncharacterized delta-60 repeat protein
MKKITIILIFICSNALIAQNNVLKNAASICGNGIVEPGEQCDGTPGCTSSCSLIPAGTYVVEPSYGIKNNISSRNYLKTANRGIKLNPSTNAFYMTTNWNYEGATYSHGGSTGIVSNGVLDYQWDVESSNGGTNLNKNFPLPIVGNDYVANLIGEGINLKGIEIRQITNPSVLKATIIPFDIGENDFDIFAATTQADGKILLAGRCILSQGRMIIIRLNTDYTFDKTFNSTGYVKLAFGSDCQARAIGVQSEGKIIVAGHRTSPGSQGIVARLNTNGTLDTTFGDSGSKVFNYEINTQNNYFLLNTASEVYSMFIASSDNIYLCGAGSKASLWNGKQIPAFRGFTASGADWISMSDLTHTTETSLFNLDGSAYKILPTPNESFYLGGYSVATNNKGLYLQRFDSVGNVDTNFNFKTGTNQGFYDISSGDDVIFDMAMQTDSKIILVGESDNKGFYTRLMDSSLAIASFESKNKDITLWPNPVLNSLNLKFERELDENSKIVILDLQGKEVFSLSNLVSNPQKNITINNLETLPSGMYFVKVQSKSKSQFTKFFKN